MGQFGGTKKPKKSNEGVQAITSAFTHMANTVASAFSPDTGPKRKVETSVSTPTNVATSSLEHGISPGR